MKIHYEDIYPITMIIAGILYRVRFISEKYYDKPEEEGGLMENSIWRTNSEYAQLLR